MDEFYENQRIVDERKKQNESRRKERSANRLETNMAKKIKTTMIGALASFEDGFGYLWGIDDDYNALTQEQLDLRELWEEVRTEILNKGNMQIRAAKDELSEYDTNWNRKRIDFIKKDGYYE